MKNVFLTVALVLSSAKALAVMQLPSCVDQTTGLRVPINTRAGQQSPAFSTLTPQRTPEIFINEKLLPEYESSPATVTFIVMHECGHVNLGHLTLGNVSEKKTNAEELAADCWAAHAVHQMGFSNQQMQQVIVDVDKLPKDPDHPAGLVRAQNIMTCFN